MSTLLTSEQIKFYEILDNLMLTNYPACKVGDKEYLLPQKGMRITATRTSFYFEIDTAMYKHISRFKKNNRWNIDFLKFGIQFTASSGKTYSYPLLRDYLGDKQEDILLTATYFFTCINYTIQFFTLPLAEDYQKKFNNTWVETKKVQP